MSLFKENPKSIFNNIKELLKLAITDRHHTFHTPVFSNKNQNNSLDSRIVVLRKFNESNLKLNFHTDFRSPKIIDLKKDNNSSFLFYDFKLKIITNSGQFDLVNNKEFSSYPNQRVSIFCTNKEAKVSSSGLKYELKNYSFSNLYGATLNEATGKSFDVNCDDPDVSILVYRGNEETK